MISWHLKTKTWAQCHVFSEQRLLGALERQILSVLFHRVVALEASNERLFLFYLHCNLCTRQFTGTQFPDLKLPWVTASQLERESRLLYKTSEHRSTYKAEGFSSPIADSNEDISTSNLEAPQRKPQPMPNLRIHATAQHELNNVVLIVFSGTGYEYQRVSVQSPESLATNSHNGNVVHLIT